MSVLDPRLLLATAVAAALAAAPDAARAQAGEKIDPGVRGKIAVAPELRAGGEWPMTAEEERARRAPARIRRPSGRGEPRSLTEPSPELVVVLDGARPAEQQPAKKLVIQGHRFVPGQMLLPRPGSVAIENKMGKRVTIVDGEGHALISLEPGETKEAPLQKGVASLAIEEMPYARAIVRVLDRARVLPVNDGGDVDFVPVDPGEYKLVFFHGAEPIYQQPFNLDEDKVFFIDATVSSKAVVTVSVKDATVRIAVPQSVPAPRAPSPPPPPDPSPEPPSGGAP